MSVFALCVLGQACTAHAKTAFVLPLPCQSCEEKERQEECKQRRMVQPSSFPVFFRAFCTVKLCQRNADEGRDARERLYSSILLVVLQHFPFHFFLSVLCGSLPYLLFPELTLLLMTPHREVSAEV